MFIQRKKGFLTKTVTTTVMASVCIISLFANFANANTVNILNWEGQIGPTTLENFTRDTGIKVIYDTFDSNEVLEGKLMVGNSGFDIVSPSDSFLARQLQSNLYLSLDKTKLPNLKNMDADLMALLANHDPDNKYAIPYVWMTTGVGYNVKKIKEVFGQDFTPDSWSLVFEPENMKKLEKCGIAFIDAPTEIFASVLKYLGDDPNSTNEKDYTVVAYEQLSKVRPYIRYFHSSQYISDLATGDICLVLGWAGDVMQASNRAKEADNGIDIQYYIPKEGALLFFDTFAIPKDAKNVDEAHAFLNYIMRPEVGAEVTNSVFFANANEAATPFVKPEIVNNPAIYPPADVIKNAFTLTTKSPKIERVITRTWSKVRTGK